ncbi:lysylphosphatidylglycerol synthase transmembrane domain-containing protein [Aquisalimonas sp.]|uniref:lysylphosphatidylglycerol synthase transmembrane domain-containing protein n=1 Tax=Aquisalimonas sp. TaxID=1872621 RepID=UPI0025C7106D|nr:lysylphosphatidylglycerol synthase transmembrane domain-containing protein [Aquisalimonas sp.]
MTKKKQAIRALKLILTAVFLYLLWKVPDHQGLAQRFSQIDGFYLTLFVLVGIGMLLVSNAKWHALMKIHGAAPGFWTTLRIYFIGYYFTALLPSNFGGDGARIYLAARRTGSSTGAATSVFMERITGLVVLVVLVAALPLVRPDLGQHLAFAVPALICAGALAAILAGALFRHTVTAVVQSVTARLMRMPRARRLAPVVDWLARFLSDTGEALRALWERRRVAWQVWSLTAVFYLLTWINILVAFGTFGFMPPADFIPVTPVVLFMSSLPVAAAGNLGYTEGVYAYYFSLVGISLEATVAVAILIRLKVWLLGGIGMILFMTGRERAAMSRSPASDDAVTESRQ